MMINQSKLLDSIYLICGITNLCIRLPTNLICNRISIILRFYFLLLKCPTNLITILEVPCTLSIRLIICKCSLIVGSIWKYPFRHFLFSILPKSIQFHSIRWECVCACSIFLAESPPTWIYITVSIWEYTFSMT